MIDVAHLNFKVSTSELDAAAKKIAALGIAIAEIEAKQKSASQVQKESSRAEKQALKDASELAKLKAKLAEAESQAASKANGTTEANKKQANEASKLAAMLDRLNGIYTGLSQGNTRGEASILHMAKTLGASQEQFQQVKKSLEQIATLTSNPFDNAVGSIRKIQKEMDSLNDRSRLAAEGVFLTGKQLQDYSRLGAEIRGQLQSKGINPFEGEGLARYNEELKKQQSEYSVIAREVNNLKSVERVRLDALADQKKISDDLFKNNQARQKQEEQTYKSQMQEMKNFYAMQEKEALHSGSSIAAIRQKSSDDLLKNSLLRQRQEEQTYRAQMQEMKSFYAAQEQEAQSAEKFLNQINQRIARDAAAARYVAKGASASTANYAAGMQTRGVDQSIIDHFVQSANAKDRDAKAARELASANKFIIDTEAKLASAMSDSNQNLNRRSTDELVKYQRALATVGITGEAAAEKLQAVKTQLDSVAGKERANQLNHLSRAISTQMGDVGISLASGMNPLTVMLQQGDQIRFALMQAGAQGKELEKAMTGAAAQIASSMKLTFQAMGSFVTGTFKSLGNAVRLPIEETKKYFAEIRNLQTAMDQGFISPLRQARLLEVANINLMNSFSGLRTIGILGAVGALAILGTALYKTMKEHDALVVTLSTMGGSLGLSAQGAENYARSLNGVGVATNKGIEAISEMAKAGVFVKEDIDMVAKAAVDMQKYGGVAIADTIKEFVKMKKDPVEALIEVAKATGNIAPETVKAATELKHMGDTAGATKIAMQALADSMGASVQQMKTEFTGFGLFIKNFNAGASAAIDKMVNDAMRVKSPLEKVEEELARLEAGKKKVGFGSRGDSFGIDLSSGGEDTNTRINALKKQREGLLALDKQYSEERAKKSASDKLLDQANATSEKYQLPETKLQKEKLELQGQLAAAQERLLKGQVTQNAYDKLKIENDKGILYLNKKIKEAHDAQVKKDNGPKSSFGGVASDVSLVDNTPNIQREYSSAFGKAEKAMQSQREILKLSFEANLISRGEYIAKDVKLIAEGEKGKLNIISEYGNKTQAEYEKMQKAVEARRSEALRATHDPESVKRINLKANDELKKLKESNDTFKETQGDKTDVVGFESAKRYYESIKAQNEALKESKKDLEDLNKAMVDASEARRLETEYMSKAIFLSGAEEAGYAAKTDALKKYAKIISGIGIAVQDSEKTHTDFTANMGFDAESINKAFQLWAQTQTLKDQMKKAGIDSETAAAKAAIDEQNKYYMQKAVDVRDGTASAITDAIMSGGKAGSDAIKGVLDNILKDMLNNVFKKILGSVGDMIVQSIVQSTAASKAASSGGGFLESIVKMGLNAVAGSVGAPGADVTGSSYALSSGSDMTSGFKMRATGGFVNQGSEYMVGERGPEMFIPKQAGTIIPNHKLGSGGSSASADPMKVTIINNTSSAIGKVTERQISPTERALIIEEAVLATAAQHNDPNSKISKSLSNNYRLQRNR